MTKNKIDKTNCCVFGCNTCRKNEPEACFHLFPHCGVKPKYYAFIENVFGSKGGVERRKAWESALLMGKPSSNHMRVVENTLKIILLLLSILKLISVDDIFSKSTIALL
jgi:hypothetical protein